MAIQSACASREEARRIAEALVAARLAACVQLSEIESVYRWEGRIARATETLLTAKTLASQVASVATLIRRLHSYTLPEIVALPILDGAPDYLAWIAAEVASPACDR